MPSRSAAAANDTRVRVDGFSKKHTTVSPRKASTNPCGRAFIAVARLSVAASPSRSRSTTRRKWLGMAGA